MSDHTRSKPNVVEYIGYCYGRRLPDSMRDWVRNDLAGKGATTRMMIRVFVPALLIMVPFWFIPTTLDVYAGLWPDSDDRARSAASAVLAKRPEAAADGLRTTTSQAVR